MSEENTEEKKETVKNCTDTKGCVFYNTDAQFGGGSTADLKAKLCNMKPECCARNILRAELGSEKVPEFLAPGQVSIAKEIIYVMNAPMIEELRQKKLAAILSQLTEIKKTISAEESKEIKRQKRLEYLMSKNKPIKKKVA